VTIVKDISWQWPFSRADLTAGLRRSLRDLTLQVSEVQPMAISSRRPSIGALRGLQVKYRGNQGEGSCRLVVKEPRGTTRTGLAGAGRREVGVYQFLSGQLPLILPALITASPTGDWLLLEAVPPARDASRWQRRDYMKAIEALVALHDRFWALGEDLNAFTWLSRPITKDFEVHVTAGTHAVETILYRGEPASLAKAPEKMQVLKSLTDKAELIIAPLRKEASTLLHGDYWPGNISVMKDGSQIVYDWQLTAIGPAILDLLVFIKKSVWWFDSLPIDEQEIIEYYRKLMERRIGVTWSDEDWERLWEHALMWRFIQEWLDLLAASPDPVLLSRAEQLEKVWLKPVLAAVEKRLGEN